MNAFLTVFLAVFLAEIGDKTQLAVALFAADDGRPKLVVFAAALAALAASTAIAVLIGSAADRYLSALPLKLIAGAGFIVIGALLVGEHLMKS
jgi:putative Ca2+/H+ antiporter (TMEM165/GDT1 family)